MKRFESLAAFTLVFGLAGCAAERTCESGQAVCGERCVEIASDPAHCGACGQACAAGEECSAGACRCRSGLSTCDGVAGCVDLASDPRHCGGCDAACAADEVCSTVGSATACRADCAAGQSACGSACVDLASDPGHCGTCDRACGTGERCRAGACAADLYVACFNTNEIRGATAALAPAGLPVATDAGPLALGWLGGALFSANDLANTLTRAPLGGEATRITLPANAIQYSDLQFVRGRGELLFASNAAAGTLVAVDPVLARVVDEVPLAAAAGEAVDPWGMDFAGDLAFVALHGGADPGVGQELAVVDLNGLAGCAPPDPTASLCDSSADCAGDKVCVNGLCQRPPCAAVQARIPLQPAVRPDGLAQPVRVLALGHRVYVTLSDLKPDYTPAGNGRLAVIDADAPALLSSIDLGDHCQNTGGLAAVGSTIYVACGSDGLADGGSVVSVDVGGAVPLVGPVTSTPGVHPNAIAICGGVGYVGDAWSGQVARFALGADAPDAVAAVCPNAASGFAWAADVACAP